MKQGRAQTEMGAMKVEPRGQAINPGYAATLGQAQYPGARKESMTEGRGATSPEPESHVTRNHGSQGEH